MSPRARTPQPSPMSATTKGRLGGLSTVTRLGRDHMAAVGRKGAAALDRRIAQAAGIPDDLPPEEYAFRLRAARRLYYLRMIEGRWSRGGRKARRP